MYYKTKSFPLAIFILTQFLAYEDFNSVCAYKFCMFKKRNKKRNATTEMRSHYY